MTGRKTKTGNKAQSGSTRKPAKRHSLGRRLLKFFFSSASALAIFAAGWAGGWLAVGGPLPCALLGAFMFVGLFAMLVGERFKQEAETEQLNEALARHQKR